MSKSIEAPALFQSPRGRIELVEVARGLAALAVALLHGATGMRASQYSGHIGFDGLFRHGFLGVDFFFVLSGFIILFVHFDDVNRPDRIKRYGWRRLVRIFPTYWIIFAIILAFNQLIQHDRADISGPAWLAGEMFLLKDHLLIGAAWTLQHEIFFYIVFISLIFNRYTGLLLITAWMGSIFFLKLHNPEFYTYTLNYLEPPNVRMPWRVFLHPINFDFAFGMCVALVARKAPRLLLVMALFFGGIFVAFGQLYFHWQDFGWNEYVRYPWIGSGFAALLAAIVFVSRQLKHVPVVFTFLGTISYSLYLSHALPISIVYAALARLGWYQQLPDVMVFGFGIAASILFAGLCYHWLEQPLMKRLQKLVS